MRLMSCVLLLLSSIAVAAPEQTESLQQRYNNCMLENLDKARTDRAVVVLSEICQFRSQQTDTGSVTSTNTDSHAKKAQYCELLGYGYVKETGRCSDTQL